MDVGVFSNFEWLCWLYVEDDMVLWVDFCVDVMDDVVIWVLIVWWYV